MNLAIVTGYREYLLPRRVSAEALLGALQTLEPRARLPVVRWWGDTPTCYHDFLGDADVELFFEYLEDTTGPDEVAFAILPPPRVVELAIERYGARCRRLYLTEQSQAVLRKLHPDADRDISAVDVAVDLEDMRANYTHAVLRLAEPLVARESLLAGEGRAALLGDVLCKNQLSIRPELGPERILAALEPGGELYQLLTRPLLLPEDAPREVAPSILASATS